MSDIHWSRSVHHDGSLYYVVENEPLSFGSTVKLRVRTGLDAPVGDIFVRTNPDGEQHMAPLRLIAKDTATCWWEGDMQIKMVRSNYRFLLLTDEGHCPSRHGEETSPVRRRQKPRDSFLTLCYDGRMKHTMLLKLVPTEEQHDALLETMHAFNAACNYVAAVAFAEHAADLLWPIASHASACCSISHPRDQQSL